jgi:hypothetical protein
MARRSGVLRGLVALPPPPHRHALPQIFFWSNRK